MSPTTESPPKRVYCLKMRTGGDTVRVHAEILCTPSEQTDWTYRLKSGGQIIGEFPNKEVIAWWIEEVSSANPISRIA